MKKPLGAAAVALTATDLLGLEMRYSGFKFIMQHLTKEQPITFLMMNVDDVSSISNIMLASVVKFVRVVGAARITGTRSAIKMISK